MLFLLLSSEVIESNDCVRLFARKSVVIVVGVCWIESLSVEKIIHQFIFTERDKLQNWGRRVREGERVRDLRTLSSHNYK